MILEYYRKKLSELLERLEKDAVTNPILDSYVKEIILLISEMEKDIAAGKIPTHFMD